MTCLVYIYDALCMCAMHNIINIMHLHDGHLEGGVQIAREGVPWLGASCIAITTAWHFMRWYTAQICVTHALYRIGADVWQNAYSLTTKLPSMH